MPLLPFEGVVPELSPQGAWVAPGETLIGRVRLRAEASVWYQAVLRGDAEWIDVGARSNVQDGCVFHTDPGYPLTIGEDCTIGHRAILHGCRLGRGVLVGMGAIILNGASVGDFSIVGAGCLILEGKTIPERSVVVGNPGRVLRQLREEEIAGLLASADEYVHDARPHAAGLP